MCARLLLAWLIFFAGCLLSGSAIRCEAADSPGQAELDQAIEAKLSAKSLRDFSRVIDLCQAALDKGLDAENTDFAKKLLASTLTERGEAISEAIFGEQGPDPRWPQLRFIALDDLERSLKNDPQQPAVLMLIARLQVLPGGDRKRAISAIDGAVKLAGDDKSAKAEALLLRSGLSEQLETRLADLAEAIALVPEDPKPLRARGAVYLAEEQAEKALADFDAALKLDAEDAATHEARGLALTVLDKFAEARQAYSRAAELEPDSASIYLQRARVNFLLDDEAAAEKDVAKALELDPQNIAALLLRAQVHQQKGQSDAALADVNEVLGVQPKLAPALRARAALLADAGKFEAAIADLEAVRRQDPKDAGTLVQLALLHANQKRIDQALDLLAQAIREEPDNWALLRARGDTYLSVGRHEPAVADFEQALKLKPDDSGLLNNFAWVLATSPDDAIRNADRSIELATRDCEATHYKQAHILSTLAAGYAEKGDFETAIKWSKQAVELSAEKDRANLSKELQSYEAKKPWRERQNVLADKPAAEPTEP